VLDYERVFDYRHRNYTSVITPVGFDWDRWPGRCHTSGVEGSSTAPHDASS
jgi:hypothetical protein